MKARWLMVCAVASLALTGNVAVAQGRGHGRGEGREKENRGQAKKAEREEVRFADHDRAVARNWYFHNRRDLPPGLRDRDRLPPGIERRLQRGWVFDDDDRVRVYPAPPVLVRVFAPPPPGCRYVIFGGHLILVDDDWRVHDVIHLEVNFGG